VAPFSPEGKQEQERRHKARCALYLLKLRSV
jgi:hypothetical protein